MSASYRKIHNEKLSDQYLWKAGAGAFIPYSRFVSGFLASSLCLLENSYGIIGKTRDISRMQVLPACQEQWERTSQSDWAQYQNRKRGYTQAAAPTLKAPPRSGWCWPLRQVPSHQWGFPRFTIDDYWALKLMGWSTGRFLGRCRRKWRSWGSWSFRWLVTCCLKGEDLKRGCRSCPLKMQDMPHLN